MKLLQGSMDAVLLHQLEQVSSLTGVPLVAAVNVHTHVRSRKPLQDVITAVRLGTLVSECGFALQPNAEAHLRSCARLGQIYPEKLLAATLTVYGVWQRDVKSGGEVRHLIARRLKDLTPRLGRLTTASREFH